MVRLACYITPYFRSVVAFARCTLALGTVVLGAVSLWDAVIWGCPSNVVFAQDSQPVVQSTPTQTGQARISVEREVQGSASYVLVKIIVPVSTHASSFVVASPPRIVVDLEGTRIKKSSTLPVPNNPVLKQIRIGAHPEKLRVVLDVVSDPPPSYEQFEDGQIVVIRILEKGAIKKEPATDVKAPPAPALSEEVPASPTALSQPSSTPTPTITTTPTPTSAISSGSSSDTTDLGDTHSSEEHAVPPQVTQAPSRTTAAEVTPQQKFTQTPANTATATATPTTTYTPSPLPTNTPLPTATSTATSTVTPKATVTPDPRALGLPAMNGGSGLIGDVSVSNSQGIPAAGGNSVLQPNRLLVLGYRFDYLQPGRLPIIKVTLIRPKVQVQMSKVDSKTYKIVVPNAGLASSQLALPQFPPADFVGFTMVTAQEMENRVEISILVEPGVTLGTFVRDNEIWIKRM